MDARITVINQQRLLSAQELVILARISIAFKRLSLVEEYIRAARVEMELVKGCIERNPTLLVEIEMLRMSLGYLNKQVADVDAAYLVARSAQRIMQSVV